MNLIYRRLPLNIRLLAYIIPVLSLLSLSLTTTGFTHDSLSIFIRTEEYLPPITEKDSDQLINYIISVTSPEGKQLAQLAIETESPIKDTNTIAQGLSGSQIPFSENPLLSQFPDNVIDSENPVFVQKYLQDPIGNSIAVITLIGMVICTILVTFFFLRPSDGPVALNIPIWLSWPGWIIPTLCTAGIIVAGYMSYVEITHTEAICGPLGDCNSVQQSPYALLWGFLPVGVLGMIGYFSIGMAWLGYRFSSARIRKVSSLTMWGMALLGTIFSMYLTFLEPFVIGATCAWCITSAIIITLLLLATTRAAVEAMALEDASSVFNDQA